MWENKKITVVGVGGVGGYFGGYLAEKGLDVTFIARGKTLESMKQFGLRVDSDDRNFVVNPVKVTDNPSEVGTVDLVLVCVKAPQLREVADAIKPMVGEHTMILPLQNGVEAHSILMEVHDRKNVLGGLAKILSNIVTPGHIQSHGSFLPSIEYGELDGGLSPRIQELKEMMDYVGINSIAHEDVLQAIWLKMIFGTSLHGVATITRSPFGVFRSVPESRKMVQQSFQEIADVATAVGIQLPEDVVENNMKILEILPADSTTSMQRDIMQGKPSELGFLVGAVVRIGKENSVETPLNNFIYSSLLPMELKAQGKIA
ncbi:MAG: ketopantoate reductase family protein [Candidatus Kariarchaeaceae archaeon]|jgi:2-dehydropantoate 2-reductase